MHIDGNINGYTFYKSIGIERSLLLVYVIEKNFTYEVRNTLLNSFSLIVINNKTTKKNPFPTKENYENRITCSKNMVEHP